MAFTAHHVIAADLPPGEVLAHILPGDLGAPMNARFLAWLGERLGTAPGSLDVVLCARGLAGEGDASILRRASSVEHDRVARAERYREDILVYTDRDETAVVILGRGLALRPEVSLEVREEARSRGLGRRLLVAARALVQAEEFLFAQVATGNAASLRAFLGAGFTPIGAEVLFLRRTDAN